MAPYKLWYYYYFYYYKTDEPTLLQIGRSGQWSKVIKRSTSGSEGHRSRSHNAEVRFRGLVKTSFLTPSVEEVF